jgi:ankyrin repeat protein
VASHPLRVEELAEILAFDFKSGAIPKFHKDWRLQNPVEAVLSACSTLLSIVDVETYRETSRVVQFTHFTVKEFLTCSRFAEKHDSISRRYHISISSAHTFVAQACLGMLLHLGKDITNQSLTEFPLAEYAAEHWFEHARFENASQDAVEGMKLLFDWAKPHLSIWLWIHNPTAPVPDWMRRRDRAEAPSPPLGIPLHYAAFCGLREIAKVLVNEHPQSVNSQSINGASTPLHLALHEGHVDLARMLVECGTDPLAQDEDGWTALHFASRDGHVDLARMLIERGADGSNQNEEGPTALHLALENNHVDLAWILLEHGVDVLAQGVQEWTALHIVSRDGHVDLARVLIDRGADVSFQTRKGWTPLHLALHNDHADLARMLVERGADVSPEDKYGSTALQLALEKHHVDIARILIEHGADVSAEDDHGMTPL